MNPTQEQRQKMSDAGKKRVGEKGNNWRGGKDFITAQGYVMEFDETKLPQKGGRHTPRYRRVMEEKIGRKLLKGETVHHINGIKADDCPENLYLCTLSSHRQMHNEMSQMVMELFIKGLVTFNDGKYYFSQQET